MKYVFKTIILAVCMMAISFRPVWAANNKFGIHLAVPSDEDIQKAADLVNGNGGSYGYVTLVIQENNRNTGYWQQVFDKLREHKLIPIIRIATEPQGANWRAPNASDAGEWAHFLNGLNWVTKSRYVILFNEPNHATEWGGSVNMVEYGRVAASFAYELKESSPDFVIMLAGLDLSAPDTPPQYADAHVFFMDATKEMCDILMEKGKRCADYIDAISSHAYPNPGFVGSPYDAGRRSIRGYEYELNWYGNLTGKSLPVFITETGWDAHALGQETVASYYAIAFQQAWLPDERIIAVTPFVLNYQGDPFLQFSFLSQGGLEPYPKFTIIQSLSKVHGTPTIIDRALINTNIPSKVVEDSTYDISVSIQNSGQAIWDKGQYTLVVDTDQKNPIEITSLPVLLSALKPSEDTEVTLTLHTGKIGSFPEGFISVQLVKEGMIIGSSIPRKTMMEPKPSIEFEVKLMSKGLSTGADFEIQLFDAAEHLVYKQSPVLVTLGRAHIDGVSNIIPGKKYRVVLLKPYYLPRQVITTLAIGVNDVSFDDMLPLDFDRDGQLTIGDIKGFFLSQDDSDLNFVQKMQLFLPSKNK